LILLGLGRLGMFDESTPPRTDMIIEFEKQIIRGCAAMERDFGSPS
jgi:hypothetical protein